MNISCYLKMNDNESHLIFCRPDISILIYLTTYIFYNIFRYSQKVKKYNKHLKKKHNEAVESVGINPVSIVHHYTHAINGMSTIMTEDEANAMRNQTGVMDVMEDETVDLDIGNLRKSNINKNSRHLTDATADFLDLTVPAGAWKRGFVGEDIVVGVIDTGIWPEHPSFEDDGSYKELVRYTSKNIPCQFGNDLHNPNDTPFNCNNKLIGARAVVDTWREENGGVIPSDKFDSARDDNGHGSHVASTAAGNKDVPSIVNGLNLGEISGIAYRSRVIAYKACVTSCTGSDLMMAINYAIADEVDVINYSISGADLRSITAVAFLNAAKAGIFVAASAGNSGPKPFTTEKTAPWYTAVAASTQEREFAGLASLGNEEVYTGASLTIGTEILPLVDGADAGNELCCLSGACPGGDLDPTKVQGKIVLCKRGLVARVDRSKAVLEAGGEGVIFYNQNDEQTLVPDLHSIPTVHITFSDGLQVKDYINSAGSDAVAQINPDGDERIVFDVNAPVMGGFSSRGPNYDVSDIIKPDITAPGVEILAAWSPESSSIKKNESFAIIQGTSMSSPHTAGYFALIKQAQPDWSPAMAKSALMTTAYQDVKKLDENGVLVKATPFDMGAGHVNGGKVNKNSFLQPGLVYDVDYNSYLGFICGADPDLLSSYTTITCDELESEGIDIENTANLNVPSIGIVNVPGGGNNKTVSRTVTSVANGYREFTANVESPDGYEITVKPLNIRLKQGESATFDVTVTSAAFPSSEWKFGSLTWIEKNGLYEVRSPIAVRGILLFSPQPPNQESPCAGCEPGPESEENTCGSIDTKKRCEKMDGDACHWVNDESKCISSTVVTSKKVSNNIDEATALVNPTESSGSGIRGKLPWYP